MQFKKKSFYPIQDSKDTRGLLSVKEYDKK